MSDKCRERSYAGGRGYPCPRDANGDDGLCSAHRAGKKRRDANRAASRAKYDENVQNRALARALALEVSDLLGVPDVGGWSRRWGNRNVELTPEVVSALIDRAVLVDQVRAEARDALRVTGDHKDALERILALIEP